MWCAAFFGSLLNASYPGTQDSIRKSKLMADSLITRMKLQAVLLSILNKFITHQKAKILIQNFTNSQKTHIWLFRKTHDFKHYRNYRGVKLPLSKYPRLSKNLNAEKHLGSTVSRTNISYLEDLNSSPASRTSLMQLSTLAESHLSVKQISLFLFTKVTTKQRAHLTAIDR